MSYMKCINRYTLLADCDHYDHCDHSIVIEAGPNNSAVTFQLTKQNSKKVFLYVSQFSAITHALGTLILYLYSKQYGQIVSLLRC